MGLPSRWRVQGLHLDGGMADYVCVEEEFLLLIPDGLDLHSPPHRFLSVAEHCVGNRTSIGHGDKVIVAVPVSSTISNSARSRGASHLSGTERMKPPPSAARTIGFETLVVGPDSLHYEQIQSYFPDGADALG